MGDELSWKKWEGVRVPGGASGPKKNLRIYETGELLEGVISAVTQFQMDLIITEITVGNKSYTPKDASTHIKTLCGGDIEIGYGKDEIDEADVLILAYDIKDDGKQGSLRGFCCVKKHYKPFGDSKSQGYLYISLICSSGKPTMQTKKQKKTPTAYGSGADMLAWVQWYARKYNWKAI